MIRRMRAIKNDCEAVTPMRADPCHPEEQSDEGSYAASYDESVPSHLTRHSKIPVCLLREGLLRVLRMSALAQFLFSDVHFGPLLHFLHMRR